MVLVCRIHGVKYDIVVGPTFADELNETLDSGSIVIPHIKRIYNLAPYDDVYIYNKYDNNGDEVVFDGFYNIGDETPDGIATENSPKPAFYKHLLVDTFDEEMLMPDNPRFTYKIKLMSETKGLDMVPCPNISITQSLDPEKRRTCAYYIEKYINLYSPKLKVKSPTEDDMTWTYKNKYKMDPRGVSVDESIRNIFENVDCPEMSFTNPTLRDVLSQIMIVCDCIPVVRDNVVYALDISKTRDEFKIDNAHHNYVHTGMNSSDFTSGARREYSGALPQTNAQYTEYLGFRNDENALLTLDNIYIKTRFPIYKINKLTMCYYKQATGTKEDNTTETFTFLCEFDITNLILHNNVRNALSADFTQYSRNYSSILREDLPKCRIATLGYNIGDNKITGWGEKYSYATWAWFSATKTYIENLVDIMESFSLFGDVSYGRLNLKEKYQSITTGSWKTSIIVPKDLANAGIGTDNPGRLKAIFFKIEYEAMYNGAIIHSKENVDRDDLNIVDNQSSALTITERDGLFEHEKLKRLGNRNFSVQARFSSFEEMNDTYNNVIGAIYEGNVIIYHREIQIYDDFIIAKFIGTYNYVLKNYFTSVFARLRTYNYMSYGESVSRAQNDKKYIVLSLDKLFYENPGSFVTDFSVLSSAIRPSEFDTSRSDFVNNYKVNFGYFGVYNNNEWNYYQSDIQRVVSGYSLCFNIRMGDNITGGAYVSHWQAADVDGHLIDSYSIFDDFVHDSGDGYWRRSTRLQGSTQEWYVLPSDEKDPFISNIKFAIGTSFYMNSTNITNPSGIDGAEITSVRNLYTNIFDKMPKLDENYQLLDDNYDLAMGGEYEICKDNKEIIDMTFQLELFNKSNDYLQVSNWFMKLNDLYGENLKTPINQSYVNPLSSEALSVTFYFGWWFQFWTPSYNEAIVLRIRDNLSQYLKTGYLFNTDFYANEPCYVVEYNRNEGIKKLKAYVKMRPMWVQERINDDNLKILFHYETYYMEENVKNQLSVGYVVLTLSAENNVSLSGFKDYKVSVAFEYLGIIPESFDKVEIWDELLNIYRNYTYNYASCKANGIVEQAPANTADITGTNMLSTNGIYLVNGSGDKSTLNLNKNMFISTSNEELHLDVKYESYASLASLSNAYTIINTENDFGLYLSLVNNYTIRLNLAQLGITPSSSVKSVQYWFLNNTSVNVIESEVNVPGEGDINRTSTIFGQQKYDNQYHFVLGVNLTDKMKQDGYVDIYVSLMQSKSELVYDYMHNEKYRNLNYINSDSVYGEQQLCSPVLSVVENADITWINDTSVNPRVGIAGYSFENDIENKIYLLDSYYLV